MINRTYNLPYPDAHLSPAQCEMQLEIYKHFQQGEPLTVWDMFDHFQSVDSEIEACFMRLELAKVIRLSGYSTNDGELYRVV
ncbi:hypothetical protein [Microvirga aerophila]|uniref:Uncharacterized protein n=1 Tax=Microvirga aerophila TaxID=670291 RepID=A0A512C4I1_9HYPH|nr:hypothetical protein [Microvirga aerophila]GEO19122.1 hypothetical protein MAE02_68180 [Microvirga aerophila]